MPPRSISAIAREIAEIWPNPYFGAVPYLDAMRYLEKVTDSYGYDSARGIILYFLGNARTWKGPDARRIKSELKGLLK